MTRGVSDERFAEQALRTCNHAIENWKRRAIRNKRQTQALTYMSIVLTVITTALSATTVPRWVMAVTSAGAALAVALLAATKAQEHWVLSRTVQNRLHNERFLFQQHAGPYGENGISHESRTRLFAERIATLLMDANNTWADRILSNSPPTNPRPVSGSTTQRPTTVKPAPTITITDQT